MTYKQNDIEELISLLAKLPGMGPRSAQRAVLYMIQKKRRVLTPLSEAFKRVHDHVQTCLNCENIGTDDLCQICANSKRETGQICVVETAADLWAIERAHAFHGRYHVLGGTLNALESQGPDELKIPKLVQRLQREHVVEVILALSPTIDGQTTAHYIAEQLPQDITITSLAQGIPMGGELDYLDDGTIYTALSARKAFNT